MMHTRLGIFSVVASLLFISVSCSKEIDVMSVSLSESSMTLMVGETATLLAVVEPSLADYDGVKWYSSDPSVVTVSDGVIQVHRAGTASITASAGGVISGICTVTVDVPSVESNEPAEPAEPAESTEPAEPAESTESAEPAESTEPAESDDTVKSSEDDTVTGTTEEVTEPEGVPEELEDAGEIETDHLAVSGECFIYDVDFGEEGSFIDIDSLVTVVDWRDRDFNDYPNYWGYYGPFVITFDLDNAECDLNGERQSLPKSVTLIQTEAGATGVKDPSSGSLISLPENRHGFLMCKFSTTGLTQAFNIYVKAVVKYGFGTIQTDWIKIPVVMDPSI